MIAIGLAGPSKAGKSTLANEFKRYGFSVRAFADVLRSEVYEAFVDGAGTEAAVRLSEMVFRKDSPEKELIRPLFQAWGTLRREVCGKDYWVNRLHEEIKNLSLVVIDDVRYVNEAEYIKTRLNGIVVTLLPERQPPLGAHESETQYLDIPADLELPRMPLNDQVDLIMSFLKTRPRQALCCKIVSPSLAVEGLVVFDQKSTWKIYTKSAGFEAHAFGEQIGDSFAEILLAANAPAEPGKYRLTRPHSVPVYARSFSTVRAYAQSELGHDAVD